ncbi:hypothetical protein GCM10028802_19780 [Terrabacter terrigena]
MNAVRRTAYAWYVASLRAADVEAPAGLRVVAMLTSKIGLPVVLPRLRPVTCAGSGGRLAPCLRRDEAAVLPTGVDARSCATPSGTRWVRPDPSSSANDA